MDEKSTLQVSVRCIVGIIPSTWKTLATDLKRIFKRGPTLKTVQLALANRERNGEKYSEPEKDDWEEVDHYARCLYELGELNRKHRDAAMRGMPVNEAQRQERLWPAIKRATHARSPSRKRGTPKQKGGTPKKPKMLRPSSDAAQENEVPDPLLVDISGHKNLRGTPKNRYKLWQW